jgi:hypothetical protein
LQWRPQRASRMEPARAGVITTSEITWDIMSGTDLQAFISITNSCNTQTNPAESLELFPNRGRDLPSIQSNLRLSVQRTQASLLTGAGVPELHRQHFAGTQYSMKKLMFRKDNCLWRVHAVSREPLEESHTHWTQGHASKLDSYKN